MVFVGTGRFLARLSLWPHARTPPREAGERVTAGPGKAATVWVVTCACASAMPNKVADVLGLVR